MNHLYEQLTELKLTGFRDALKNQITQPGAYQELGFEERLSLLASEELTCRENRKAERLVKQARFRLSAELSKLDYRSSRGLDKALIRSLGQGNWLNLKQNLLLTGATGSGKTYLDCALGHNACRQGYRVYYYRLKALMDLCYQEHADGRYSKLLTKLNHSDLLLLDDWGAGTPVIRTTQRSTGNSGSDVPARLNHSCKPVAGGELVQNDRRLDAC